MLEKLANAKAKTPPSGPQELAGDLDEKSKQQSLLLRHPRDREACLEFLSAGRPSVLVLKLGGNAEEELTLLLHVTQQYPDSAVVVVGEPSHAYLAGLAWDLGASYVMILPQPQEMLTEIVAGLLKP